MHHPGEFSDFAKADVNRPTHATTGYSNLLNADFAYALIAGCAPWRYGIGQLRLCYNPRTTKVPSSDTGFVVDYRFLWWSE